MSILFLGFNRVCTLKVWVFVSLWLMGFCCICFILDEIYIQKMQVLLLFKLRIDSFLIQSIPTPVFLPPLLPAPTSCLPQIHLLSISLCWGQNPPSSLTIERSNWCLRGAFTPAFQSLQWRKILCRPQRNQLGHKTFDLQSDLSARFLGQWWHRYCGSGQPLI